MDLLEVGCGIMHWIDLAQYRDGWWALVDVVLNFRVPYEVGKPVSFSRKSLLYGVCKWRC